MTDTMKTTTLTDASGCEHRYEMTPVGATQGMRIGLRLQRVLGMSLGELMAGMDGGATERLAEVRQVGDLMEMELGGGLAGVGKGLGKLAELLLEEGGPELFMPLLATVRRQRQDGTWERVGERFDHIYQANYAEMLEAIAWVLKGNYGSVIKLLPFGLGVEDARS